MYISDFKLKTDGIYWQSLLCKDKDSPPILKTIIISTGNDYDVIIKDCESGIILTKDTMSDSSVPISIKEIPPSIKEAAICFTKFTADKQPNS